MIWLARDDGGRDECSLAIAGRPFAIEEGVGNGGDVDGNDGERGDRVRGKDVRGIPNDSLTGGSVARDGGLRGVLTSPPEDVRAKGRRAVPGGCRDNVG
jgi:hypothetical protein